MEDMRNCPHCGSGDWKREKRTNGFTECNTCGFKAVHSVWDSMHQKADQPSADNLRLRLSEAEKKLSAIVNHSRLMWNCNICTHVDEIHGKCDYCEDRDGFAGNFEVDWDALFKMDSKKED